MRTPDQAPALAWVWPLALLGALYATPAALITVTDPTKGLALAAGVLPAAALGLPGPRRARVATIVLGVLIGASMTVGALLAEHPVIAVIGIFALSVLAALMAPRGKVGRLALGLCLPMVGIGLSFGEPVEAAGLGLLMAAGSVYACAVSMLWPARPRPPAPAPGEARAATGRTVDFGIRLGLAASTAAAIGFAADLEHVGWACAAVLLVMRPSGDMVRSRGVDRTLSVLVGATGACLLVLIDPSNAVLAVAVAAAVIALAATNRSKRYITGTFTTFVVFLLLLNGSPQDAGHRFLERVLETLLGVGLALLFGVIVPRVQRGIQRRRDSPTDPGR